MPYSFHSHSGQFCRHAQGDLESVVKEAIRQRFVAYGLTEHVPRYRVQDLYPEEAECSLQYLSDQFDSFVAEAERLRDEYSHSLNIIVGLETENISPLDIDKLSELLVRHDHRIDYVVGSVHHVHGVPIDFDLPTFQRCLATLPIAQDTPLEDIDGRRQSLLLDMYFDAQYDLLQAVKPEIIGHIDLCRLYTPSLHFRDYPSAWVRLERNIKFAVAYGALFEANAAALRKGWATAYPGADVVELILQHGGRFALSDDSHGPHAVGLNYGRLRDYLLRAGVRELWALERSKVPNPGGRYMEPVRVEGDWWDHAFWGGR
ncbi:histidinol phosphate phosphatase H [Auriscalpium vulgare]|uniref:Histidinol phosphate phosphatase H n=1 Tax=Auriscalpium vulgare TaxID=40419 RepID=A0ACB8RQM0_9AGAM|nr:histidinol phosphate phosphatase H [Auriscalpium vulgare]